MKKILGKQIRTKHYVLSTQKGFTLIEVLMGISILMMITFGIYFTFGNVLEIINRTRDWTLARSLLDREIEFLRSLQYGDVGIVGGAPAGLLLQERTELYEAKEFTINAFVRNIDDAFDGTVEGDPADSAPADYKLVELQINCENCLNFKQMEFTTWVAPENLETTSSNGSLFINVFDANGEPVADADVRVENNLLDPTVTIIDSTDNAGQLKLIDIPPSVNGYEITVTKTGYSSAQTYLPDAPENPNPIQPHSTVSMQDVTLISFAIDKVSTIELTSQDHFCQAVSSVSFTNQGDRLIGSDPDVFLYDQPATTNSSGNKTISDLPWDVYDLAENSTAYDAAGWWPMVPLELNPDTTTELTYVLVPAASSSLVVTVLDGSTGLPITSPASVQLTKAGFSETKQTGEWSFGQTDWQGFQYITQDGLIDSEGIMGQLTLFGAGVYPTGTNSWLVSNAFDLGTPVTQFNSISWAPNPQPSQTSLWFQLASNNDQVTWMFVGPDGTANTYYTTPGQAVGLFHDGNQYLRYRILMNTLNASRTPMLTDMTVKFSSGCTPPAQAFWNGLSAGTYTITVTKSGFANATSSISVTSDWQEEQITLIPQ